MSNAFNFKVEGDAVTNLPSWMGSTTYGKDVYLKVDDLSSVLFKELFPNAKANDVNGACSVDGHGDTYGLHDVFLGLTYILGKAEAEGFDIEPVLNPPVNTVNTGWSEAYKKFVLNKEYLTTGNEELGYDNENTAFCFRDLDANGIPELIIDNGFNGLAKGYVFSYDGTAVVYCGDIYMGSAVDGYPGIVTELWYSPWAMTDEDAGKYSDISETYYSTIEDYTVVKKLLQRKVIPIGASDYVIEYQEEGELSALIGADSAYVNRKQWEEISQMSWDEFVSLY